MPSHANTRQHVSARQGTRARGPPWRHIKSRRLKSVPAIDETLTKTVAMGPRLDLLLAKLRVGLFFDDLLLANTEVERAKGLLEQGGDWERRNRLKVYEALLLVRAPPASVGASSHPLASSELPKHPGRLRPPCTSPQP